MKIKKLKLIFLNVSKSVLSPIFGFIILLLGIKILGKEFWGNFLYYYSWILLLSNFPNFGNRDFLLRKFSEKPSQISQLFSINFCSRLPLLLISIILAYIFLSAYFLPVSVLLSTIFIYNSLSSIIVYNQYFGQQLWAELLGFVVVTLGLYGLNITHISEVLYLYSFSIILKILFFNKVFKTHFNLTRIQLSELKNSFIFFMIALSGLLVSKLDIYLVNLMVSKSDVSLYNSGMAGLTLLQSFAFIIILPFTKHIYRLPKKVIQKIHRKLWGIGIVVSTIGVFFLGFLLNNLMHLSIEMEFYVFASLSIIPIYFYLMEVMQLYKEHKELELVKICFLGAIFNGVFSYFSIDYFGYSGGVLGFALSQWILLGLYRCNAIINRNLIHLNGNK